MTEQVTAEVLSLAQRIEAEALDRHCHCQDALRAVCLELAKVKAGQIVADMLRDQNGGE
jgi:hypothetical protein